MSYSIQKYIAPKIIGHDPLEINFVLSIFVLFIVDATSKNKSPNFSQIKNLTLNNLAALDDDFILPQSSYIF